MIAKINSVSITFIMLIALSTSGCTAQNKSEIKETTVKEIDLSNYKDSKPERKMRLLFIHHSCGGQWLAEQGEEQRIYANTTIYKSHPNGGNLRALLAQNNYEVHEASYKSTIGEKTDICDWNAKFRDRLVDILKCDVQDTYYKEPSLKNDIVMFKSCFPNSEIEGEGRGMGQPDSPERSTANYKAAYNNLLNYFKDHPDTLFVAVTAPPVIYSIPSRTKEFIKRIVGSESTVDSKGERARRFNNWLKDAEKGWLAGYTGRNVVVFDYYNVLTKHGESNHLLYPTQNGTDSHPSAEGNSIASRELVQFLNKAVKRLAGA